MDKKMLIMHAAMEQFADKGYHHTTMQDIADAAGIAKGGIYFYFKSKEELLLTVITEYFDRLFNTLLETSVRYAHRPKEGLVQQIMNQFQEATQQSSIITLLTRGQIDVSPDIKAIFLTMRTRFLVWFRDQIISVYGARVEPYAFDLSALLTSLVREYMGFIFMNGAALPLRGLAEYLVARVDDATLGIMRSNEPPMLTTAFIKSVFPDADISEGTDAVRRLYAAADALRQQLEDSDISDEDRADIRKAIDVLKEEAGKPKARRIVLEGMAALLKGKALKDGVTELAAVEAIISEFS